ncbi:MAG TPA: S24 family peptidase [Cellvibrio sp.]|nr:S24 family peptidase [Cellvibrio sp.]
MKSSIHSLDPDQTKGEPPFYKAPAALLDLDAHITQPPAETWYMSARGDSMIQLGIYEGDLLVVNTLLEATHGDLVIVSLDGEKLCKVLDLHFHRLLSGNDSSAAIPLNDLASFTIEGVVTHSLRYHRDRSPLLARRANSL